MQIKPNRSNRRLTAWTGAVLLGIALVFSTAAGARQKKPVKPEIAAKQADLTELRGRIEAMRKELAASESNRAHAADRLRESEREISTLQRELHELAAQRNELQATLKDLDRQSKALETTLGLQQAQLERLLYRQYIQGAPDSLQLMLNGGDPNELARDMVYVAAIAKARAELLAEMRTTLEKKQALAEDTKDQAAELAEVEAGQTQRHNQLLKQRVERKTVLNEISGRIAGQRKEIGHLQQDEKRLSQLVDRLSKLLAARAAKPKPRPQPEPKVGGREPTRPAVVEAENQQDPVASTGAFAKLKGSLRLPARGAVIGRFGAAREGGGAWKGVFIRAGAGSEVKAVSNGRVVFAEWMRGFGNLLIIDHGDAYLSIYGNNESLLKQVGETVRGGETVASVGNSGGNPETGLYFELRHQGQPIDPMKWASLK
ncbi:MAG: murein hydrolase activator EnvC family protein [Betaproteobacteria bacterium]